MLKFIRKLIAFFRNTFLADCPVCHKHFYGFHNYEVDIKINNTQYRIICHRCADEYKKD